MVSTKQFTVSAREKWMASEISCLGDFEQIYPDSADAGLTIVSETTGRDSKWVVASSNVDGSGEVINWILHPTTDTLRRLPDLAGWYVVVYND